MRLGPLVLVMGILAGAAAPPGTPTAPQARRALEAKAAALERQAWALSQAGSRAEALSPARQALALYRQLYPPADYPVGHVRLAVCLNDVGLLLRRCDDLDGAERCYRESLAMLRKLFPPARHPDGHTLLASGLNNLGLVLRLRGDLEGAERCYREALAINRKLFPPARFPDGHPDTAGVLNNLGYLLSLRGDLEGAERCCREALAMRRKLSPPARYPSGDPELANAAKVLGGLLRQRGDLAGAEPLLREALAMRRRLFPPDRFPDGHPALASSLNGLAELYRARGEYARAEALLREALAMQRRLYPPARYPSGSRTLAIVLTDLGLLLADCGRTAEAEPLLREGLAINRKLYPASRYPGGHPVVATGLANLGKCFSLGGKYDRAEACYREALPMLRRLYPPERFPDGHPEIGQCLNNLATALVDRGEHEQAGPLLREAVAVLRKVYAPERFPAGHPDLAVCLANWAMGLYEEGRPAAAEPFAREALAMVQRLGDAFAEGAAEAEALNFLAALPATRDVYLSVTRKMPAKTEEVYAAVWQGRASVFRLAQRRRLALLAAADPRAAALARDLAAVRRELTGLLLAPAGRRSGEHLRYLAQRKEQLEKDLAGLLPALARGQAGEQSRPADLRAALPPGTAFIDVVRYARHDGRPRPSGAPGPKATARYVAFVLTRDRPVCRVELAEAAPVERALAAWRRALAGAGRGPDQADASAAGDDPARDLRRRVWEPLAKALPPATHTVWLAPDGALTGLPWAALPGGRPGTVLLEEYALAVVPHGRLLLEGLRASRRAGGVLLAVGNVDYDAAPVPLPPEGARPGALRAPEAGGPRLRWPALPGTARELARVLALAGSRPALAREAAAPGTARLLEELPKARWAHLATHGFFADKHFRSALQLNEMDHERSRRGEKIGAGARNPLVLSGLALAGANLADDRAPPDRGILTAEAIVGLDLDAMDLAVLSACETGLGEVAGGEGTFGLQRAFHVAGARNVVASLWKVDDEATCALMALFYHHLWEQEQSPLEALRQAQLALYRHPERIPQLARARGPDFDRVARRPAPPQAAHAPARLWAGFVLSGAGR